MISSVHPLPYFKFVPLGTAPPEYVEMIALP
jgi:hypothetical protein